MPDKEIAFTFQTNRSVAMLTGRKPLMPVGLIVLLSFTLLAACTHNEAYRTDMDLCTSSSETGIINECAAHSVQILTTKDSATGSYLLGFIEFDDQGEVQNYDQVLAVRKLVQRACQDSEIILLVFVHGWKHNAHAGPEPGEEDNNITHFRDVLRSVSKTEYQQNPDSPRKVVGVYLGWRGLSVTVPGIKELSFWERKNTAHKVGAGAFTEILLDLENQVVSPNKRHSSGSDSLSSRYIIIGHSFGGAAVYSALSHVLVDHFMAADCTMKPDCEVSSFADLVVLVNPAFEAMHYAALRNATDRAASYANGQLPVLAILTSEDDSATKSAFPLGRFFSTIFERERADLDQKAKSRTAVGHYVPYQTHRLEPTQGAVGSQPQAFSMSAQLQTYFQFTEQWDTPSLSEFELPQIGVRLIKTGSTDRYNPYLSIYVDGELIPDHNDIYDQRITEFIRQLIMLSIQEEDPKLRAMQRSSLKGALRELNAQ
jgi:hypothetical protein